MFIWRPVPAARACALIRGFRWCFYHHDAPAAPDKLPRYLDLGFSAQQDGTPFTFSSNLLHALHAAVKRVNWERRFAETAEWSAWLRERLTEMGFNLIGNGALLSPAVITIALPPEMNSTKTGEAMQEAGYLLSYNSEYLRRKNWIQVCLMGECTREKVVALGQRAEPRLLSPPQCSVGHGAGREIKPQLCGLITGLAEYERQALGYSRTSNRRIGWSIYMLSVFVSGLICGALALFRHFTFLSGGMWFGVAIIFGCVIAIVVNLVRPDTRAPVDGGEPFTIFF